MVEGDGEITDRESVLYAVERRRQILAEARRDGRVAVNELSGHLQVSLAAAGDWPARMLAELVIDVAFLGTNGISVQRGLSCPDLSVSTVKRAAVASSRCRVLLADASKFGRDSFSVFARTTDLDLIVTESATSKQQVESIRRQGVQVVLR